MSELTKKQKSLSIGAKGWPLVIIGLLLYWMGAGWPITALNVIIPGFNAMYGWDAGAMNNLTTVAQLISILGAVFCTWLCGKTNAKFVTVAGVFLGAISLVLWGRSSSLVAFTLFLILLSIAGVAFQQIGLGVLVANWYPTKKGLVMGIITIGATGQGLTQVSSQTFLMNRYGFTAQFDAYAVIFAILGILGIILLKNNPEEAGAYPDNDKTMTKEMVERLHAQGELYQKTSPWTVKKLLTTKDTWFVSISTSLLMMFTVGVLSNFVPLCASRGMTIEEAALWLAVGAIISAPSSYIWGIIDQRIGTRKAIIAMYVWFIVFFVILLLPFRVSFIISMCALSSALGGANNFWISFTAQKFGRYDFTRAWGVVFTLGTIFRSFAFSLVGGLSGATGSYTATFVAFLILSVVGLVITYITDDKQLGRNYVSEEELSDIAE